MSANSQCFLGLHATCFQFRPPEPAWNGFLIVRETSAIIVEDLFMKRLSKIDDVHVLREIHPGGTAVNSPGEANGERESKRHLKRTKR